MAVFWKKDCNGTSLRDPADAMKINSSLYNTIGDRQELFLKCVKRYTGIRRKDLEPKPYKAVSSA